MAGRQLTIQEARDLIANFAAAGKVRDGVSELHEALEEAARTEQHRSELLVQARAVLEELSQQSPELVNDAYKTLGLDQERHLADIKDIHSSAPES